MKGTRRSLIDPPSTRTFAVVPLTAILAEDPISITQNMPAVFAGAGVVIGLALVLSLLRTFNEEFARRSRPRIYTLPRPGERNSDPDPDGLPLVMLMILVIIAAAVIVGVKF